MRRALVAGGVAVTLVAAGVAALVATSGDTPRALQPPSVAPAAAVPFPVPPRGAVVFARQDRTDVLALAVRPQPGRLLLRVSIVGQQGHGVRGLGVSVAAGGAAQPATSVCGAGCYEATVAVHSPPRTLRVVVRRPRRTTAWRVQLPAPWPARDATALVARATRVWTHLRSLSYVDRLRSDPVHLVVSHWQAVAPDRLAYQIEHSGEQAVIVGHHRWDRTGNGAWEKSPALGVDQPQPFWVEAVDAHVVGSRRIGGRPVWRVSFFDPKTLGWFLVGIDRESGRTLDVRMWATAHFMHDTYGHFNAPIRIVPP